MKDGLVIEEERLNKIIIRKPHKNANVYEGEYNRIDNSYRINLPSDENLQRYMKGALRIETFFMVVNHAGGAFIPLMIHD